MSPSSTRASRKSAFGRDLPTSSVGAIAKPTGFAGLIPTYSYIGSLIAGLRTLRLGELVAPIRAPAHQRPRSERQQPGADCQQGRGDRPPEEDRPAPVR